MHNISGYSDVRDKHASFEKWITYQMWREDSLLARYPTFYLVLQNHKMRCQL